MPLRPTFAMVKSSSLPAAIGVCPVQNAAGVAVVTNEIQERLLHDPLAPDEGWHGGWVKMVFNVLVSNLTAYVVTPFDIARLILLDVCARPTPIRNGFYEYLQFSRGLEPKANCNARCSNPMEAFERDNVVTFKDYPSTPQLIRVYVTDNSDVGKRIVFQGPDQNGQTVLNLDIATQQSALGEVVYLQAPFSTTLSQFASLTGILKSPTRGQIQIFTVDPATGVETLLSTMEPRETTAWYRRYLFSNLPAHCCNTPNGQIQITAQAKLDFSPVVNDSDYLLITSIPALVEEAMAWRLSRQDTANAAKLAVGHHAQALRYLFGMLDHVYGKVNTAIRVPIAGSDRFRLNPR